MSCYYPIRAWRGRGVTSSGKTRIVFRVSESLLNSSKMFLPCGQCVGCRLERSRQWAIRCVHEASLYEFNCSITLSYSPYFLPKDGSVSLRHFQLFFKLLRKYLYPRKVRFFHCGEYGDRHGRPHYHAILFNYDFPDKRFAEKSKAGFDLFQSNFLDRLWNKGRARVAAMTFESAAYVARYCLKKITGKDADEYYAGLGISPEYVSMSKKPGIGKGWYDKYKGDVFPSDEVVLNGMKLKPPRFYDGLFESESPDEFLNVKRRRMPPGMKWDALNGAWCRENDTDRLFAKEYVKSQRSSLLGRNFESEE